jgi:hypothetical protein
MIIPWIVLVAAVIIGAQGYVYRRLALRRLTYTRYFGRAKARFGETIDLVETIENRKWLPLPWVRIESLLPAGLDFHRQENLRIVSGAIYQNHRSLFHLGWYTKIVRRHRLTCSRRGFYRLETATLTSGDMFGITQVSRSIPLESTLVVLPRLLPLRELSLPSHSWMGDFVVRRWIVRDPFMIAGVREYQPGDPLKTIAWKATARTGRLQGHQQDFTADRRLFIVLNIEESENMWKAVTDPERIEHGISVAATLAKYALDYGMETGFVCNGSTADAKGEPVWIPPAAGSAHFEFLLEQMGKLVIERACDTYTMLERLVAQRITGQDMVWITAFVSERMLGYRQQLMRMGNAVEIYRLEPAAAEGGETDARTADSASAAHAAGAH